MLNISIYCTEGWNISQGRRQREIFTTEGVTNTLVHKEVWNICFITYDIITYTIVTMEIAEERIRQNTQSAKMVDQNPV